MYRDRYGHDAALKLMGTLGESKKDEIRQGGKKAKAEEEGRETDEVLVPHATDGMSPLYLSCLLGLDGAGAIACAARDVPYY
ncbi:hypothetical protein CSPX01_14696 [Colletotrichum filicis]|nr:hypothetical protein CSPX01_14696 [Colletotrichum filicis]